MTRHTRQEAKALGLNKCYGSACTKHPELEGFRWVSGACVECARELLRKNREANPEKTQENRKKSNLKVAEQRKPGGSKYKEKISYGVQYRKENRDSCRATIVAWSARNPEKVKLYAAKTKANNKGKVNAHTVKRRLAKINRTPKWLTADEHWMIEQAYELAAQRTKLFGFAWHVDHILPLQGKLVSGLHTPYNLQVIPGVENVRKSNKFETVQ
jgi:hypothetical protein